MSRVQPHEVLSALKVAVLMRLLRKSLVAELAKERSEVVVGANVGLQREQVLEFFSTASVLAEKNLFEASALPITSLER